MPKILLATRNQGKIREISAILDGIPCEILSANAYADLPDVVEDGKTLEENALKKARTLHAATGIASLADDTGLEVVALHLAPGVRSARYAGEGATYDDNNRKLLAALAGLPPAGRGARFRCVAALVDGSVEHLTTGMCNGSISDERKGSAGFGYDPLFIPDGYAQTFAELTTEIKNRISHRSQAFRRMKEFIIGRYC